MLLIEVGNTMSKEAIEKMKTIIECPDAACGQHIRWQKMPSQDDSSFQLIKTHDHPYVRIITLFAPF